MFYENHEQKKIIQEKLEKGEHFAINRFGEGEIRVIMSQGTGGYLRCIAKSPVKEWQYDPKQDKYLYEELKKSFLYKEENYLKASIKEGNKNHIEFVENTLKDEKLLSVHYFYLDEYYEDFFNIIVPYFKKYKSINFLCSNLANYENINIKFDKIYNEFQISNAWKQEKYTESVINEIKNTENCVYLFCIGFNTKIMIRKLFQLNKNNVYYDFGAHLDQKLYGRRTRGKQMK